MFSIIIAAKDSEKWIQQTIDSLIHQTYEDWQCIFSINGSKDKTREICNNICLKDNRFAIIESSFANKSSALNRGIIFAIYDWISILDSDDLWTPDKLMKQKNFIKNNENIDIIGSQMQYIDSNNNYLSNTPKLPLNNQGIINMLDSNINPIANSSVCYKKNIHDIVGYYDTECYVEDYDIWKRCRRAGFLFSNINDILMLHRIHSDSNFNSTQRQENSKKIVDILDTLKNNIG